MDELDTFKDSKEVEIILVPKNRTIPLWVLFIIGVLVVSVVVSYLVWMRPDTAVAPSFIPEEVAGTVELKEDPNSTASAIEMEVVVRELVTTADTEMVSAEDMARELQLLQAASQQSAVNATEMEQQLNNI